MNNWELEKGLVETNGLGRDRTVWAVPQNILGLTKSNMFKRWLNIRSVGLKKVKWVSQSSKPFISRKESRPTLRFSEVEIIEAEMDKAVIEKKIKKTILDDTNLDEWGGPDIGDRNWENCYSWREVTEDVIHNF